MSAGLSHHYSPIGPLAEVAALEAELPSGVYLGGGCGVHGSSSDEPVLGWQELEAPTPVRVAGMLLLAQDKPSLGNSVGFELLGQSPLVAEQDVVVSVGWWKQSDWFARKCLGCSCVF